MFDTHQNRHYSVIYNLTYIICYKNALEIERLAVSHQPWSKSKGEHDKEDVHNYNRQNGTMKWQVVISCDFFFSNKKWKTGLFNMFIKTC